VDWRSSTRGLSQIWLQVREKSRNFLEFCYILALYKEPLVYIWRFLRKFPSLKILPLWAISSNIINPLYNKSQPHYFVLLPRGESLPKKKAPLRLGFSSLGGGDSCE